NNDAITIDDSLVKAYTNSGSAYLDMQAGLNLEITNSDAIAQSDDGYASVYGYSTSGDITVTDSDIEALSTDSDAYLELTADNGSVTITNALASTHNVRALVDGNGDVEMYLYGNDGDVIIHNGDVTAETDDGDVYMEIYGDNAVSIDPSNVLATVNSSGDAEMDITAGSDAITIDDSLVKAYTNSGDASVDLNAQTDIGITNSDLIAESDDGEASLYAYSTAGDITVTDSDLEALSDDRDASIELTADDGSVTITNTAASTHNVKALVKNGSGDADIDINANGGNADITNADLTAETDDGDATVDIYADGSITIDPTNILATVNGSGDATINLDANTGSVTIDDSLVKATVSVVGEASVAIDANQSIDIDDSTVNANTASGEANVDMTATNLDITVSNSLIQALTAGSAPYLAIEMTAGNDILIDNNSTVETDIGDILLTAGNDIGLVNSEIISNTGDIELSAKNNIDIDYIETNADVTLTADSDSSGLGAITDNNGDDTNILGRDLIISAATGIGSGNSLETEVDNLEATNTDANNIEIDNTGALTIFGSGVRNLGGGDVIINVASPLYVNSVVSTVGLGDIYLNAHNSDGDIFGNALISSENGNIDLIAGRDIVIDALSPGVTSLTGDIELSAVNDVDLGYLETTGDVTVTADSDSSGAGAITDNNGANTNIVANNLTLAAAEGIGSGDALETQVSTLDATNTDSGNIEIDNTGDLFAQRVINQGDDIYIDTHSDLTLGYLEAIGSTINLTANGGSILDGNAGALNILAQTAELIALNDIGLSGAAINTNVDTLAAFSSGLGDIYINEADSIRLGGIDTLTGAGHSVAANEGIIHITSAGDMVVNSVIAPRGGVFLQSTGGNIFAGQGWCPIATVPSTYTMDLAGTDWQSLGGIDYFSQVTNTPLPDGPNVISGGYSYISAPNGTIGVGLPTEDLTDPAVVPTLNPLLVNVQAFTDALGNPVYTSALPAGVGQDAGLTIEVGGKTAHTVDTGDGNGPRGISAEIEGIVRPGTTAVTDVYPSPAIDTTNVTPPGYIFYNDSDASCASPLFGPAAANLGSLQIWPKPLILNGLLQLSSVLRDTRVYYELTSNFRVTTTTPILRGSEFYAYHPLTVTDETAFDSISLDVGAYEFIDQNINLKGSLSPYFGGSDDEKKKKKGKADL
ncbi:MAG: hypothetical protein ABIH45_04200, partial [Candidatus Omnitrophota bacterium]